MRDLSLVDDVGTWLMNATTYFKVPTLFAKQIHVSNMPIASTAQQGG